MLLGFVVLNSNNFEICSRFHPSVHVRATHFPAWHFLMDGIIYGDAFSRPCEGKYEL